METFQGVRDGFILKLVADVQIDLTLCCLLRQDIFQDGDGRDIVGTENALAFPKKRVQFGN